MRPETTILTSFLVKREFEAIIWLTKGEQRLVKSTQEFLVYIRHICQVVNIYSQEEEESFTLFKDKQTKVKMRFKYNPEFVQTGLHLFITEQLSSDSTKMEIFGKILKTT